jgi:hypothetical protein
LPAGKKRRARTWLPHEKIEPKQFQTEDEYYGIVQQKLSQMFESKGYAPYFEITATRTFSNTLKSKIPDSRHIIFYFLKDVAPDITGFITKNSSTHFVVIEIKNEEIKLDYIYQARKYAELFDTKFAFLVSTEELPEEIKRLQKIVYSLLNVGSYREFVLVHYDGDTGSFRDWYPENPFEKEYLWR